MLHAVKTATVGVCAAIALSLPTSALAAGSDLTTWLFAEGSTNASFGFEQEILIGNPNTTPVSVTFELFTQDGEVLAPVVRTIEPLSRYGENIRGLVGDRAGIAIRLSSSAPIIAERTMFWGGGLFRGGKNWNQKVNDLRGGHNEHGQLAAAKTWYFAEGEGKFFNTFISVANPNNTPATVTASYRDDSGVEVQQTDVVPANGRRTFWPTAVLSPRLQPGRAGFATIITSDLDVVAERQMYWGPGNGSIQGGHAAAGVTTPSATWLFAEGIQGALSPTGDPAFDTFVLFFNQNATPIDVKVEFFGQAGAKLAETTRTIGALSRDGVWAKEFQGLINQAFSIRATSTTPFVAERAVYWRGLSEGTATAGATAPALKWGFAEGLQGGFQMYQDDNDSDKRRFNTFFPIYNPGVAPATVTVHFYTEGGNSGVTKTITVPAQSRETVWTLLYDELANAKFATFFSSTQPIVVERVVYWGKNNKAGHASMGIPLADDFPLTSAPSLPAHTSVGLTVTPNKGVPGGGTKVAIEGAGFGNTELGTQVLFGGVPAREFEVENDGLIKAVTPTGTKGTVDVSVVTRGQTQTLAGGFTYFDPLAAGPTLSFGNLEGVVAAVAAARPFDLLNSCKEFGGNNTFMFEVVVELRKRYQSNRWGLNWKRGNVGDLSQDIVNYYSGPEGSVMRNSTAVRIYDTVSGHCGPRPAPFWADQTQATLQGGTVGRWTTDPMCAIPRYRDAKFDNGEWMFPECR